MLVLVFILVTPIRSRCGWLVEVFKGASEMNGQGRSLDGSAQPNERCYRHVPYIGHSPRPILARKN
eukprot:scaffold310874_cov17-Prasinocladus_malaysianus.AAC.1